MLKKILVTGATGMLGTAIHNALTGVITHVFSSSQLDITNTQLVEEKIALLQPDYIINAAAYTAVDLAETEKEKAYAVNAAAVEKLAQIARKHQATLIHFSTDYVFDGTATTPYLPQQATHPINVYGQSKLAGEKAIIDQMDDYYIFRTSWLYAPYGKNFFNWVATTNHQELRIVNTQIGSPTSALDLAAFINTLIHNDPKDYGIYHYVNKGEISWYDFARLINKKMNLGKSIVPISHYPTAAQRPAYSVMDCLHTQQIFTCAIASVSNSLDRVIEVFKSRH